MKLKDTIYSPKTNFSMRAHAVQKEPEFLKLWDKEKIYEKSLKKHSNHKRRKHFYLHHGPPYANGEIHLGHCLNVILKDIVQRHKLLNGFYAPMMFGWDTHGLPIEHALLKKHKEYSKLKIWEFRQKCREYAKLQVEIQKKTFKRLGLIIDFSHNYYTMDRDYEADQIRFLYNLLKKNYIYRAKKPIIWSWSSKSALAEAEVEYKDIESPSIYVLAKIVTKEKKDLNKYILLWTTTPWTLPSNEGIAYSKKFSYIKAKDKLNREIYLSKESFKRLNEKLNLVFCSSLRIEEFKDLEYESPIKKHRCLLYEGHHVEKGQGSGFVHLAPGHGKDDYIIGIKNNLPINTGVDEKGIMLDNKYQGMFYTKANKNIINDLEKENLLLLYEQITHSFPTDWRTGKPVIFRAATQWFINVRVIKDDLLLKINDSKWFPKWAKTRILEMINNRDDWCISRQRQWGVPIAIYYKGNGEPIINDLLFDGVEALIRKHGSDVYYSKPFENSLILHNKKIMKILTNQSYKEHDIMDVWFDSGITHHTVMWKKFNIKKSDLYLEGTDQFRGWFNSSLITSMMLNGDIPFKTVVSHGFIVDKDGKKMSKSKGNGIPIKEIINKYGVDTFRLFVANSNYDGDVRISDSILKQTSILYRKFRNLLRFLLSNLNGFNETNLLAVSSLEKIDLYILAKYFILFKDNGKQYFNKYNFRALIDNLDKYCTSLLSSLYFEISKDTLYVKESANHRKKQYLTVFSIIFENIILLLSPILPFLAEDAYQNSWLKSKNYSSIHLLRFKEYEFLKNNYLFKTYNKIHYEIEALLNLRNDFNKIIDEEIKKGNCKKASEVTCHLLRKNKLLQINTFEIKEVLQCAIIETIKTTNKKPILFSTNDYDFYISINKSLKKCSRCWLYFESTFEIYKDKTKYNICKDCKKILDAYFPLWK